MGMCVHVHACAHMDQTCLCRFLYPRQYPLGFALRFLKIFEELAYNDERRRIEHKANSTIYMHSMPS